MALTPPSTPPTPSPPTNNNTLSDIFSDSPPTSPSKAIFSDIPRLQSTHATAGYRAGIAVSKERSLQPGFDEGYSLGAVFGLRVGYFLGVLEGLRSASPGGSEERARMKKVGERARDELAIGRLFGREWWGGDGVWVYEVQGEGEEVTFREVVGQHPVVSRWAACIAEEIDLAGVRMGRFEGGEWERGRVGEGGEGGEG